MNNNIIRIGENKIIAGLRYMIVHKLPGLFPFYLVTEYPRSGGTWLGQLISGYSDIPFPRNTFPKFGMSLVHGHYLPSSGSEKIKKILWLVRDGRDVIVSSYYYYLFPTDTNLKNPKNYLYFSSKLGFDEVENIRENLPKYIEFMFTHKPGKMVRFVHEGDWVSFNRKWLSYIKDPDKRGNLIRTSYEALLKDTENELSRIVSLITGSEPELRRINEIVEQFSFKRQTGRNQGEENIASFLRKGVSGDWKNCFSREAAEIFNYYAGDMLLELGYESGNKWVDEVG